MTAFELAAKLSLDSSSFDKGLGNSESKFSKFGNSIKSGLSTVTKIGAAALTASGAAAFSLIKSSVQEGMQFDKAMSQVAATMGKSVDEVSELRDFAREMGASTAYSATEAAEALNYMALAGYDSEKSMQMLPKVLNLAAAGGMDLASASDMVTDASSALGLSIEETDQLIDKMAKTSSKSNTSVSQLGEAILTIGGTAKNLSGGTTELSAALGILADNGIKGAEGGTALRNIVLSLTAPTDKAAKAIKKLGVDVFDSDGKMRDMPGIFSDLNEAMAEMSDDERISTLNEIFNKNDMKSINALLATSSERWGELYKEINNSSGAAQDMADTQLDNLDGDVTKLKSAFGELKISISDKLTGTLRTFVQTATSGLTSVTNKLKTEGLIAAFEELGTQVGSTATTLVTEYLPKFIDAGKALLTGLAKGVLAGLQSIQWPTWDDVKAAVEQGWNDIQAGIEGLGKIIFGEKVDGTVNWPTWADVGEAIKNGWDTIKKGVAELAKIVFGENVDGSIKWPTWADVSAAVESAWDSIVEGVKTLTPIVFGENIDVSRFDSVEGVISLIGNAWQWLKDTITKNAINMLTAFFGDADPNAITTAVTAVKDALIGIGAAIIVYKLTTNIGKVVGALRTLFTLDTGTSKIALILAGIAAAFTLILEHWDDIEPVLADVGALIQQNIIQPIQEAVETVKTAFNDTIGWIKELMVQAGIISGGKLTEGNIADLMYRYNDTSKTKESFQQQFRDNLEKDLKAQKLSDDVISSILGDLDFTKTKEQMAEWLQSLDAEYKSNPLEEEVEPEITEEDLATQIGMAQSYLDSNTGVWKIYSQVQNPDTGDSDGYWNGTEDTEHNAKGLWDVPYNDYVTRLHRGEMVLSASRANDYRNGSNNSGVDISSLVSNITNAVKSGMENATVRSYLNGKDITSEVNRSNNNKVKARRYT